MPEEIIRVLSIEDNADYAQFIRDTLCEAAALGWDLPQFKLTRVDTLVAALARLDEGDVDVVLSDLDLPDSQASDTFVRLRDHAPDMPIVVLTGRDDETLARYTMRAGAADHLFKREMSGSLLSHALLYAIERQRAGTALKKARDDLERQVQLRTAELEQANTQLRREITERTQAEESQRKALAEALQATQALRDSEKRYRDFFTQSFEGFYRIAFDHPIDITLPVETQIDLIYENAYMAECNQALAEMYHLSSPQALIGTRMIDAHGGKDNPVNRATLKKFIEGGYKSINDETLEHTADGEPVCFLSSTVGILEDGYLVQLLGSAIAITKRKRAEMALQESEERFRLITETIPDIVFQLDLEGRVTYCSSSAERVLGYTSDEVMGIHLASFFPTSGLDQAMQNFEKATTAERVDILKAEILDHAGLPVTVEAYLVPILRDGQVIGVQGVARDITEREHTEEALRESEAKYRTLFEGMAQGVFYQRADGALVDVNPAALEMFGLTHDQFLGRTSMDPQWHVTREDGAYLPGKVHPSMLALKTGEPVRGTIVGVHNPQREETVWLSINAIPQFKPGEDTPYQVFVTLHDITKQKRSEEALRKSQQDLQATLEATTDGIWTWNFETDEMFFSPRYYTMLGYEPDEFPASFQSWQNLIHPDDLPSALASAEQWLQTKSGRYENDFRLRTKSGEYRWIHTRGMVVERDGDGRAIRMIGNHEDITARKQTEIALEKTVAELARSNADLEQFAYVVSHDLREPLRAVTSYLQLLEKQYAGQLDEKADKFIAYAVGGAIRMQELISGLLAYSRVGTRAEPFGLVDCESILDNALTDLRISITERHAVVTRDPLPMVVADDVQLRQVFQNLIGNAIKFCREEPPLVHVSAKRVGDNWVFAVRDNGIGIDPAQTERIFGVFQRLHTPEEYPGTGMGLPICKRIVERHGGRIWVQSSSSQGSTFCFTVPFQESSSA